MYFIAKGSCLVQVRDKFNDRYENFTARTIEEGSHFGVSKAFVLTVAGNQYDLPMPKVCHCDLHLLLVVRQDHQSEL